jgi:hypothetical protein
LCARSLARSSIRHHKFDSIPHSYARCIIITIILNGTRHHGAARSEKSEKNQQSAPPTIISHARTTCLSHSVLLLYSRPPLHSRHHITLMCATLAFTLHSSQSHHILFSFHDTLDVSVHERIVCVCVWICVLVPPASHRFAAASSHPQTTRPLPLCSHTAAAPTNITSHIAQYSIQ